MNAWKVYVQLFNYASSFAKYVTYHVPITEEQYNELSEAVLNDKPLYLCLAYKELERKIETSDPLELLETAGFSLDDEEYTDDEENEEDDADWEDEEEWEVSRVDVFDPNEAKHLEAYFVGKSFPKWTGKEETFSFEENDDTRDVMYDVYMRFDAEGTVVEIKLISSEGLEDGDERHLYTNEAYPNYRFIKEQLEETLNNIT